MDLRHRLASQVAFSLDFLNLWWTFRLPGLPGIGNNQFLFFAFEIVTCRKRYFSRPLFFTNHIWGEKLTKKTGTERTKLLNQQTAIISKLEAVNHQ